MASVTLEDIKNLQHKYINFDSGMTIEQIVDILNQNLKNNRLNMQILQENLNAIRANQELINGEL
jgi:hypothetical protein